MRILHTEDGTIKGVVLSRRNLESLLAKLDGHPPNSACTIGAPMNEPFWVSAEENNEHYSHVLRPEVIRFYHGAMHPDTETAIR